MTQSSFNFSKVENSTPMMKQYLTIKAKYPDSILFYRMGDFYEMFYEDAVNASSILGITLTKRGKADNQDIPMCGVPYHASETYLKNLIVAGHKVAICEQTESPEEAKKRGHKTVVNREVVRIITPGTLTEENILAANRSNYLLSIVLNDTNLALAYADVSTGEIYSSSSEIEFLSHELYRLKPSEIICSEKLLLNQQFLRQITNFRHILTPQVGSFFELNKTKNRLMDYYKIHLADSFGDFTDQQIQSLGSLIEYMNLTQKKDAFALSFPKLHQLSRFMLIDQSTRKSLELTESSSNKLDSSLLKAIDHTKTSLGSRLFFQYLSTPLIDLQIINERLDLVEIFIRHEKLIKEIQDLLSSIRDTQRCVTKLLIGRGSPRDLLALAYDLQQFSSLRRLIYQNFDDSLSAIEDRLMHLDGFDDLIELIKHTISEKAPLQTNIGGFINKGVHQQLDDLTNLRVTADSKVALLKQEYASQTGISNLKISKNNIIGYFIEINPSQLSKIDTSTFILRQSMVNSSRFTTHELRQLEDQINSAHEQILSIETEIFHQLIENSRQYFENIMLATQAIATIDVAVGLAKLAIEGNYTRPIITEDCSFILQNARHPVIERFINKNSTQFTPNDINLDDKSGIMLITGPNMAGKSTYLRQNAICAILAQMGSFVPAHYAKIGIIDRIFSRVGASDSLAEGKSTFMVEMVETASILNQATSRSFVILDEIGRGTSTYDGVSIARSVIEHIANKIKCRTLFATHYHELISLEKDYPQILNFTMAIKEWDEKIIFLHKVIKGSTDKSYGIYVAVLAGFPKAVIDRAKQILNEYKTLPFHSIKEDTFIHQSSSKIANLISEIDLDEITPKQALDLIYQLKHIA